MSPDVGIFFDALCVDAISEFPIYTNPIWRNKKWIGNTGDKDDVHLYIKNTGDIYLENITVLSADSEGYDETSWNMLALTESGLDNAEATGQKTLLVGALNVGQSTNFWLRSKVPYSTPSQLKYDIYLNVSAVAIPYV